MKIEVKVPTVGESIVSGILTRWVKKNNEYVKEGEIIFELETDKVNVEVPSPASGKMEILAQEGGEVKIGQVVAYVDTEAAQGETLITETPVREEIKKAGTETAETETEIPGAPSGQEEKPKTSPSVRRIAAENAVDLTDVKGTGRGGRIINKDILDKTGGGEPQKRQTVVKMSPIRRTIAKNLVQAKQEAAHVTTFNEIDMEQVVAIRSKYRDEFLKKDGVKLGFMSFFVKACCQALKEFPDVNTMVRGDEIVYNHFYNIGVAVSVEEGLIVPVIRDADRLSFPQIEMSINDMAERARLKKIKIEELEGGTFTITNGGIFGSMMSTPIPDYPQAAILGLHAIKDRPYVVNGKIEIRPIMYAALTYDHRVIDGRDAVEFLAAVKKYIEDPESLLIEL